MNVLVTGGAGFLGGYIIAALEAAGHRTVAYDISEPSAEMSYAVPGLADRLVLGDVCDRDRLTEVCKDRQVDAIVHAAARVGFERSLKVPLDYYKTNVMGFVTLSEVARSLGIAKLVLVSSNAVYHSGKDEWLSETDLPFSITRATPAAHYGTSKMAAEAIGMVYAEFHGIDFYALRVTAIYGFGMRNPIQIKPMVENAVRGQPTRLAGGGPMKRDYTHVLDCADAATLAIGKAPQPVGAPRILNVSAGALKTGFDLAAAVEAIIPGASVEIGSGLTELEAENVKMRAALDCSLAKDVLGWSPQWPLEAGIREYAGRLREFLTVQDR